VLLAALGICAAGAITAKPRIIIILQEGLGHEITTAARMYSEDAEIWDWRLDSNWLLASLSTQPLTTKVLPDGSDPEARLHYDPFQAWNGTLLSINPDVSPQQTTFAGYRWLIENATDRNQSLSALNSGISTYNTSLNWLSYPVKTGSPMPAEQLLLEWAKRKGLKTGVVSDMPFSHSSNTILAGARSQTPENALSRFNEILKSNYLNLYVATGHPKYNELGQALSEPKYIFCSQNDWQDLRSRGRTNGWDVVFGDENLMGINAQTSSQTDKRLVIMQFGDTSSTEALSTDASMLSANLSASMRFQLKIALSYLDRASEGFMLIIHFGRLPNLLKADLQKEALEEVINTYKSMAICEDWVDSNGGWDETSLVITSPYEYGLLWGADSSTFPFSQISNRGKKRLPGFRINYQGPTGMLTPLLIRGPLTSHVQDYIEGRDPIYGPYLHLEGLNKLLRSFELPEQSVIEQP
jgi:alkaline phosphatase